MKNSKYIVSIVLLCVVAVAILASVFIFGKKAEYVSEVDENEVKSAFNLLNESLRTKTVMYTDFLTENTEGFGHGNSVAKPEAGTKPQNYDGLAVTLNYNNSVDYEVEIEKTGLYYIVLDYKPIGTTLADFSIDVKIGGEQRFSEMKNIALPLKWVDKTKDFPKDRYGDETAPYQIRKEDWLSLYLYNNTYYTAKPLLFYFTAGTNVITITNVSSNGLGLGSLKVEAPIDEVPTYSEYAGLHQGSLVDELIEINAVNYIEKNTTQAIYSTENNPALTPHDSGYKLLNVLSWNEAGAEITYEIDAKTDGYYNIAFHYKNVKEEFDVFNTIKIDGTVPFKELRNYAFPSTGNRWANEVLSDSEGNPFNIYLTKGKHTLILRAEQEPIVRAWRYARLISEHVTQFELEITKITGSTKDDNRTWKMTRYIPQIPEYLEAYETLIGYIQYSLQDYTPNGVNSAILSDLNKALAFIEKMKEYPDEIALYREDLTGKDNSILSAMGNFTTELVVQDFALDMIYVYGDKKLPKENPTFFDSMENGIKALVNSFLSEKYVAENDPEAVNVWVNRAMTHVDLLQKMVDTEFTPKTGIKVKISVMPDANKLTLATAAGETPDVALGLISHMPFDLASRGALYDYTQFDDFWEVADRFIPGSFASYVYNEGIYAIPETLDFHSLIYRTDIFNSLGLNPPDTWQDVVDMLPTLQRYGMNFYHNISTGDGYKWFWQTAPLIYQNNGRLYTDDGSVTAIDEPNSVKGLQALGNLFIAYSLDTQVNSFFNSFRYSILPVGIVDLQNYILIKNGAPELEGQWALASYPGTPEEDGTVSRWYIANGTGAIIFKESENINESWEFLKWWTDYDTQVNYTYTLQSTYGKQFVWLSSNVDAIEASPIEQVDKQVILEQIKWLRDVPRTPGQYMLERSLSDIWNTMVFDGTSAQVAVDEKVLAINREIKKKMNELGFYDEEGNLLKPYVIRDIDWIIEQIEKAKKGGE
jgi:ABC-type glycerol-3-phosphate transport system substrate-binding protein